MRVLILLLCSLMGSSVLAQDRLATWVEQRIFRIKEYNSNDPVQALSALQQLGESRALSEADRGYVVLERAALLIQEERSDEARNLLREILVGKSDDYVPALRLMLAQLLLIEGDIDAAVPLLETWVTQVEEPRYSELGVLAYGYLQSEQFEKAVEVIERLLEFDEVANDQWYELLAYAYTRAGRSDAAVSLLDEVIARQPQDARWWRQLTNIYLLMEDYRLGAASLQVAGILEDLSLQEARRLASLFNVLEMPADGAQVFDYAISHYPEQADYEDLMLLGEMYILARETDAAIAIFQRAAERVAHGEPALKISQLHLQWERFEKARQSLLEAAERYGEQTPEQVWYLLAITEINLNNPQAAHELIGRIDPDGRYGERGASLDRYLENEMPVSAQ